MEYMKLGNAFKLTQEDVAYLEEPYVPHRIVGHQ